MALGTWPGVLAAAATATRDCRIPTMLCVQLIIRRGGAREAVEAAQRSRTCRSGAGPSTHCAASWPAAGSASRADAGEVGTESTPSCADVGRTETGPPCYACPSPGLDGPTLDSEARLRSTECNMRWSAGTESMAQPFPASHSYK